MTTSVSPDHAAGSGHRIDSPGADVLRSLGLEALIELLETTAYGVCVTGEDHSWVYLNPAGERIIGQPLTELAGKDYLLHFPRHEREVLLELEGNQRQGDTEFYTNTVVRPDGNRQMTWSGTVLHAGDVEMAPAIFHETTAIRQAELSAAELGAAAVTVDPEGARTDVLSSVAVEAVAATRACAAVLLCEDRSGLVQLRASAGVDPALAELVTASRARLDDVVVVEELATGNSFYVSDTAAQLAADERTTDWVAAMATEPWNGAALFPVRRDGRPVGVLMALLPDGLTAPSESELVLWSSLTAQAGVAVGAELAREQLTQLSAVTERSRIARDLHDSVSQALFALHARAQVIRRALAADDTSLAREAAQDLEALSRQATTEMRELLGELRTTPVSTGRLVPRLEELAEATTAREGLPVELTVSPAPLPPLSAPVVEHLPRIVGEALHNAVKHAAASSVRVTVTVADDVLTLAVEDDGRGFDPALVRGGLGHGTMRERAGLLGGELVVRSAPGTGTTVHARVPLVG